MKAVWLRGEIAYEALDYVAAGNIFREVIEFGEKNNDAGWIARGSFCRAACELELGNLGEAVTLYHSALMIFREAGPAEYRIETEWGLARVALHSGKPTDAARGLRDVIAAFEDSGRVRMSHVPGRSVGSVARPRAVGRDREGGRACVRVLRKAGINRRVDLSRVPKKRQRAAVTPAT